MKRYLFLLLALAGCASTPPDLEEARRQYDAGRGEQALVLLQKASAAKPGDPGLRSEYFRMRDVLVAQWLAQAETLRQTGQFDAAEALYRRVQAHDAGSPRAASGLAQIEADRRHRALVAQAESLMRGGKFREAQDTLRPVLTENPQQREARRLQRVIDEKLLPPVIVTVQLRPSTLKPISIELREVTVRNVFEVLHARLGRQLRLRPRRAQRPAHHHPAARREHRGSDPHGAAHQPARAEGAEREHRVRLPEHAAEAARVPGAGGEGLLPRQRRREADRQHDPHAGEDEGHVHRREDQPAGDQGHAGRDPPGRAPDRGAGPRRARGDARGRGARGRRQPPAGARHPLPRLARHQPARGRGHRRQRDAARVAEPLAPTCCCSPSPTRCSCSACASRTARPTCSPTRASA